MKFTSPKGKTRISLLSDHPLWTTLIPCNRQKTYLQVPHWYFNRACLQGERVVKVSSGLQANFTGGLTLSPQVNFTSFTDVFHSDIGLTAFKLSRLLVMHDRGKLFRVGKLSLAEHLKGT